MTGATGGVVVDGAGLRRRRRGPWLWVVGLAVVVVLAGVGSSFASDAPDGLERVAEDEGFHTAAEEHRLAASPLADYQVDGVEDDRLSVGLAGVAGVAVTLGLAGAVVWALRRRGARPGGGRSAAG